MYKVPKASYKPSITIWMNNKKFREQEGKKLNHKIFSTWNSTEKRDENKCPNEMLIHSSARHMTCISLHVFEIQCIASFEEGHVLLATWPELSETCKTTCYNGVVSIPSFVIMQMLIHVIHQCSRLWHEHLHY